MELLRVPPHSAEAEQAVLGGLMLSAKSLWLIRDMLSEGDFYRRDHQLIYRAILDLDTKRQPFDYVTMGDWLEANNLADQIGRPGYLYELVSHTPSAANIKAYAEIVRSKAVLRDLIEAGTETVNEALAAGSRDINEVVAEAQARLGRVMRSDASELETTGPILTRLMERGQAFVDGGGKIEGLTTGLPDLDDKLCGLKPGQLIVLAARPKQGKTTLARCIAEHVAIELGLPVAFHSLEMQPEELLTAAICSRGRIAHENVRRWQMEDAEWSEFSAASAVVRQAPLLLSRPRSVRVEQLVAQTRRAHAQRPLKLVVIDYLQLITAPGDNRAQAIAEITRQLKLMAGELGVTVILLSQLNRKLEDRTDKRPNPSDLRDSGAIEQDADVVLFVYRDETYNKSSPDRGTAEIIVGLQRSGPTGTARVLSRLDICRFEPLPLDWAGPPPLQFSEPAPAPRQRTSRFPSTRGRGDHKASAAGDAAADGRIRDITGGR